MSRKARINSRTAILLMLCVGILLWAKLKLVTAIPRSAYADPSAKGANGPSGAGGTDASALSDAPNANAR